MKKSVKVSGTLQGIIGAQDVYAYAPTFKTFYSKKAQWPSRPCRCINQRNSSGIMVPTAALQLLLQKDTHLLWFCVSHCYLLVLLKTGHDFMWTAELNLISVTTAEALSLPWVLSPTCQHLHPGNNPTPMFYQLNHLGKQLICVNTQPPGMSYHIQNIHMETLCHSRKSHMT